MDPSYDPKDVGGVFLHALLVFLLIAAGAALFGIAYWRMLKRREARKAAERDAAIAARKAAREARKPASSGGESGAATGDAAGGTGA